MRTAALTLSLCAIALGQTPSFEVASIKVCTSKDEAIGEFKNGRVTIHNHSLRSLIGAAYHVPYDSVLGPDWLDAVYFDVNAKTDPGTSEETAWLMLRTLLIERLGLKSHQEKKVVDVYGMTLTKQGPKFHESKPDSPEAVGCQNFHPLTCYKVPVVALEMLLERMGVLDLPVKDMTGLKGRYDIRLSLDKDGSGHRPSVFDALQDQLGLRLDAMKRTMAAIVIDHVERVPVE